MWHIFVISFLTLLDLSSGKQLNLRDDKNSDVGLTILELVPKYGYALESHEVITDDGYILTMHRIPHGRKNQSDRKKPAVLLMHGTVCSSVDFVNLGPEKAIGFLLADAGYDVWLGNQRGNTWSRKHTRLDPNTDKDFWKFSYHEIGIYDIAAKIDFIIKSTGQAKISYIGHSQGTTAFFVLMSVRPDYNKKIKIMNALAPFTYEGHTLVNLFTFAAQNYALIDSITNLLNVNEVLSHSKIITVVAAVFCNDKSIYQGVCVSIVEAFAGKHPLLNKDLLPVIFSNLPAGASMHQLKHVFQAIKSGKFRQYDYGTVENLVKYGTINPPDYNISKIIAPVIIHYAVNDKLAVVEDVEALAKQLPNLIDKKLVPSKEFGHLDFIYGKDIVKLLNNDILNIMNKYNL